MADNGEQMLPLAVSPGKAEGAFLAFAAGDAIGVAARNASKHRNGIG